MTLLHQAAQKAVEALTRDIMNMRGELEDDWSQAERGCYKLGHRDARHEAVALVNDAIAALESALQQQPEPVAAIGWLYDWTHSSALGKPDEQFTSFTTDEAHARKHDNPRAVYTAPTALQHQEEPPPECKTEEEKRAFAFGWWKAMEANRASCTGAYAFGVQEVPREPVAHYEQMRLTLIGQVHELLDIAERHAWTKDPEEKRRTEGAIAHAQKVTAPYNYNGAASPSTTRQQEVGSGWIKSNVSSIEDMVASGRMSAAATFTKMRELVNAALAAAPSTPEKAGGVSDAGVMASADGWVEAGLVCQACAGDAPGGKCLNPKCVGGPIVRELVPAEKDEPSPIPHPLPAQANDGGEHG